MSRTRAYTRKMRAKAIKRKKRITSHYPGSDSFPYYVHDGAYSKNKIVPVLCAVEKTTTVDIFLLNKNLLLFLSLKKS